MTKEDAYDLAYEALSASDWKAEYSSCWYASDRAIRRQLNEVLKDKSVLHTSLSFCLSEYEREPLTLRLFNGSITLQRWRLGRLEALFSVGVRVLRQRALKLLDGVLKENGPTVEEQRQEALRILRLSAHIEAYGEDRVL